MILFVYGWFFGTIFLVEKTLFLMLKKMKNSPIVVVIHFFCIFARFFILKMKHCVGILMLVLFLAGCNRQEKNSELIQRNFFNNTWERFDYLRNDVEIKEETTFDLSMQVSFTDEYPYDYFSMVFTVFTKEGNPYRSKGYKFSLKDKEGHWNSELKDGCYTFDFPINKQFLITDPGTYRFQIEYRMPITPLVGIKELTLTDNK
jgi:gliding motility-associated lipoprotein GldH